MGEIVDMMLDGTLCCVCGCVLEDEKIGLDVPTMCDYCEAETIKKQKLAGRKKTHNSKDKKTKR